MGNLFWGFLDEKIGKSTEHIDIATYHMSRDGLLLDAYSIFTAIEVLANIMANCEIKTYRNGIEEKGHLWYQLNYAPNANQTATEFWREFYEKLLYEGEALCFEIDNQIIIADSWNVTDMEIRERTFSNITRGLFEAYGRFKISDVLYVKYENKSASALKCGLLSRLSKLAASTADTYEQAGGAKVILNIPAAAQGAKDFEKNYKDLMENRFKSFFHNKNAVIPLWGGMQGTFRTENSADSKVKDIRELTTESLTRAGLAYKIAPALLTGDVAGLKDALKFTLTTAADPLANVVSEQLTVKYYKPQEVVENRCHAVVDTSNLMHVDIFDIAGSVEKLISSGFMNIDDVREKAGLEPTGDEHGKKYFVTKNFEESSKALNGGETQ